MSKKISTKKKKYSDEYFLNIMEKEAENYKRQMNEKTKIFINKIKDDPVLTFKYEAK